MDRMTTSAPASVHPIVHRVAVTLGVAVGVAAVCPGCITGGSGSGPGMTTVGSTTYQSVRQPKVTSAVVKAYGYARRTRTPTFCRLLVYLSNPRPRGVSGQLVCQVSPMSPRKRVTVYIGGRRDQVLTVPLNGCPRLDAAPVCDFAPPPARAPAPKGFPGLDDEEPPPVGA